MKTLSRSLLLATTLCAIGAAGALAQPHNNPNQSGGVRGSWISTPDYPTGTNDPALSPGRLPANATNVPPSENPNVAGATGLTIVHGDNSTISGDRQSTTEQKTGADTASDAPG